MDGKRIGMYSNRMPSSPRRILSPADLHPQVRIANDHPVGAAREWRDRVLPDIQVIAIVEGRFEYRDASGTVALRRGEALWIEPGVRHTFRMADRCARGRISGIHCELAPSTRWLDGDCRIEPGPERVTRPADAVAFIATMRRCAAAYAGYGRWRRELVDTIARAALLMLAECWGRRAAAAPTPRMAQMVAFVRERLVAGAGRHDLARAFAVSPAHINLLFQRELGMTPNQVLNRERCLRAWHLIQHEGLTVAQAAERVGYRDQFYCSRMFKRVLGVAPSSVR